MDHLPARTGEALERTRKRGDITRENMTTISNLREAVIHNLPKPTVSDQYTDNLKSSQQSDGSMHSVTLAQIVNRPDLLPTPRAGDRAPTSKEISENDPKKRLEVAVALLPTPLTTEYKQNDSPSQWERNSPPLGTLVHSTDWGKFAPAVHRWETITSNPAPAPTIADGKDGQHRLNPAFAEWMMGLPAGWITDCNITRNEQLKACGNGVVPQQATMAILQLLKGKQ